jgi:hypothetical protein
MPAASRVSVRTWARDWVRVSKWALAGAPAWLQAQQRAGHSRVELSPAGPARPDKFSARDKWCRALLYRSPLRLCDNPDHSEKRWSKGYRRLSHCRLKTAAAPCGLQRVRANDCRTRQGRPTPCLTKSLLANPFLNMGLTAVGYNANQPVSTGCGPLLLLARAQRHEVNGFDNFGFVSFLRACHHLQMLELAPDRYDHATTRCKL